MRDGSTSAEFCTDVRQLTVRNVEMSYIEPRNPAVAKQAPPPGPAGRLECWIGSPPVTESSRVDARCEACPSFQADEALRRVNAALEQQARSIGQVLHDEAGQTLTAAHMSLAAAYELAHPTVRVHLTAVKSSLEAIDQQIRQLSHELRPRVLDDLGLVSALKFLVDGMQARGNISISFTARLEGLVPGLVETAVYRLVQESLTNVIRHSRATRVHLEVEERLRGLLWCRIRDNVVGFDSLRSSPSGLGLIGIRERLTELGATLTLDAQPGRGTELLAIIPMDGRDGTPHSAR